MSAKPKRKSQSEWTIYAVITLVLLSIGAISQAFQSFKNPSQTQNPVTQNPSPPVASPTPLSHKVIEPKRPEPEQPIVSVPSPTPKRRSDICGVWVSATSQKQYEFVCQEPDVFQVRQINGQGLKNRGSGKVTEDGKIEADLFILPKERTAHLSLQLSPDGQKIEGTWHGDDPKIESGQLTFHRIGK
jgi:hypothetical protein